MGDVVKSLFGAVGPPGADRLARYLAEWLAGSNARLQRTAAQVRLAHTLVLGFRV